MSEKIKSKDIDLKCMVCKKELKPLEEGEYEPEKDMWDDAGVHTFVPGYGSKHDSTRFIVGICDDCIDKLVEEKLVIVKSTIWETGCL